MRDHDVREQKVDLPGMLVPEPKGLTFRIGRQDLKSAPAQGVPCQFSNLRIVLDEQNRVIAILALVANRRVGVGPRVRKCWSVLIRGRRRVRKGFRRLRHVGRDQSTIGAGDPGLSPAGNRSRRRV
jgi:hypothetical protein